MLRDKISKRLGKLDEEEEDEGIEYFSDITKVEIDLPMGFGMASRRSVTITEGYGSEAKKTHLFNVQSIHFDAKKYDWIHVGGKGTTVNMSSLKGVNGFFASDEGELTITTGD